MLSFKKKKKKKKNKNKNKIDMIDRVLYGL